jgi:hypothetical protein
MAKQTFLEKTIELLAAIPDLSELQMCPSIFSDDTRHDCDECKASRYNRGDNYDESVCYKCWKEAVTEAYNKEKEEEKKKVRLC